MRLKLTTWNLEWFGQLLQNRTRTIPSRSKPVTDRVGKALQQLQREKIAEEIRLISPDILCIQEGPSTSNVHRLQAFCQEELGGRWTAIERRPGDSYFIRGSQGIFFLVRSAYLDQLNPVLLPVDRWREATEIESRIAPEMPGEHQKSWPVNHPWFEEEKDRPELDLDFGELEQVDDDNLPRFPTLSDREHAHFRHPQTLVCTLGGRRMDFIGIHLKSKFGGSDYARAARLRRSGRPSPEEDALIQAVEKVAVEVRIKLTTEIVNIRHYIDNRFRNEPHPAIFVLGDLNDGVGREYFERRYLFHDLISNLQGDVFFAQRFLNHALFDYAKDTDRNYRWTVSFQDAWDPGRAPEILLDHILFTQGVCGSQALERAAVRIHGGAGRVEHDIHMAVNAVFERQQDFTSDHRPVSVEMEPFIPLS